MDVASQIDPTTVHVKSLADSTGVRILEQNYEYDLLNPQKLLDKYVGKRVKLMTGTARRSKPSCSATTTDPFTRSTARSIWGIRPGDPPRASGGPDSQADPGVAPASGVPNPQRVEASYLTSGITWKADYVVVLNEKDSGGDLSGWVTIDNKSGAAYPDAALKLVAGDVHRVRPKRELQATLEYASRAAAAPRPQFQEESFFEYHLYSLQGRTTIKQNQTKQISLLDAPDIAIKKELRFYGASQYYRSQLGTPISNQKVGVFLEIENTEKHRLGIPLPKGTVRSTRRRPTRACSSSARTRSITRRRTRRSRSRWARRSTWWGSARSATGRRSPGTCTRPSGTWSSGTTRRRMRTSRSSSPCRRLGDRQEQPPVHQDRGAHPAIRGEDPQERQGDGELSGANALVSRTVRRTARASLTRLLKYPLSPRLLRKVQQPDH